MNKTKKLSITLLASCILVACGGGGSSGGHQQAVDKTENPITNQQVSENNPQSLDKNNASKAPEAKEDKQIKEPIVGKQSKEKIEPPSQKLNDQDIWQGFSKNGGYYDASNWVSITLEGKEIKLAPVNGSNSNNSKMNTLRDADGNLVGYYGYATLSKTKPDPYRPGEKDVERKYMALLEAREEAKTLPTHDLSYQGKMYYALNDAPEQAKEADVTATYKHMNKSILINIYDVNGNNLTTNQTKVSENGSIPLTRLYLIDGKPKKVAGQFEGGLYGKSGEILLGKAKQEDSTPNTPQNNWEGVIGATATKDK
ncbi:membrane protein [Glaesserella parasuis]|uniref:membrane protein n=1 Tax=Glaesserella parasuis TaxID=738 RepID=UPI0004A10BAB|nr:membrane protein [Glaesserella parasuis]KDD81402.1 membrane protein [Glaesserella parasuis ST4-1]